MPDVSARREGRGAVQIRPTPSAQLLCWERRDPYRTQNLQRFTTAWVVIARAQVFSGFFKVGRDPLKPQRSEGGDPLSTPEQKCISWPEQKYISDAGNKAPELGAFS